MDSKKLSLINAFSQKKILLIGDTIIDHYIYGTLLGTSAETPTLVAKELGQQFTLGGAFLVCRNLLQLGGSVSFITLVGDDPEALQINNFSHPKLILFPMQETKRKTTIKRRYWVDGYKLLQFDQLDDRPIAQNLEKRILEEIKQQFSTISALVISDYRHGLLTKTLISELIHLAKQENKPCFVDSQISQKKSNHHLYKGATTICLNLKEAQAIDSKVDFKTICEKLDTLNVIIKKGAQGSAASIQGKTYLTPTLSIDAVDTCGAGDAFLAALSLGDLNSPEETLLIANSWAALATTIKGPEPAPIEMLMKSL